MLVNRSVLFHRQQDGRKRPADKDASKLPPQNLLGEGESLGNQATFTSKPHNSP